MKLSEIYYSNKFDDLDNQLKNFINQEKHVIFIDSKLSSIINLDPKFKIFEIEINESTKDLNTIQKIWEIMFSSNLNRSDAIVIIGGGVMLDLCSFAASTYKRGIAFTLVPSTLLAMVDASHGGKNGFNNNYGSVINDTLIYEVNTEQEIQDLQNSYLPPISISTGMTNLSGTFFNFQPYMAVKWQITDRVGLRISIGYNKGVIQAGQWKLNDRFQISDSPKSALSALSFRTMIYFGL